jgi:hypothetical protein
MLHVYLTDPYAPVAAAVLFASGAGLLGLLAYGLLESGTAFAARRVDRRKARKLELRRAARARALGLARPARY